MNPDPPERGELVGRDSSRRSSCLPSQDPASYCHRQKVTRLVIPAQAGIQSTLAAEARSALDSGFRRNDGDKVLLPLSHLG
jgi:hypothetical protein